MVYLSKDPVCRVWEQKVVHLLDNFLLELTVDGLHVIGFAPLCGCSVARQEYGTWSHRRDKLWRHPSGGSSDSASNGEGAPVETVSSALVVTCYTSSQTTVCATATFCITLRHSDAAEEQLGLLEQAISAASSLGVGDVYSFGSDDESAPQDIQKTLLGRGSWLKLM